MEPKFTWDEIFVKGELFASVKCTVVQRARAAVDWNVQSVSDLAVWRIDKQHSAEGEDYCVPFVKVRYTVKNGGPLRTSSWMPLLAFHAFFLDRSKASEKNAAIEGDHTVVMEWVIETLARQLCSTCKFPAGKDPKFCRLHNTAKASKGKGTGRIGGLSAIPDNSWKSRLPGGFTFYPVAKDHLGFALMSTATNEEATRFGYVSNSRVFSIGAYRLFRTAFDTMNVPDMTDSALTDAGLDAATIAEGNKRHSHKRKLVRPSLSPPSLAGGDGGAPAAKRSRVSEGGDAKPTAAQQQLQQPQSVAASKSASKLPSSSSASSSLSLQPSAGAATTATATAAAASKSKRPEYRVVGSGVPPRNDSIILAQWRSALRIVDGMHCDLQMRHSSTLKARDNEVARADARAKAAEAEAAALRARESSGVLGGAQQQQQQQQSARDSAVSSSAAASEQQQQQASSDALALRAQLEELRAREAKLESENAALKSDLAGEKARNLEKEKTVKQLRDRLYGGAASSAGSTVFSSGSTAASPALVAAAAPAVAAAASSPVPPPTTSAVPSQRPLPRVVGSDSVSAAVAASSHRSLKPAPAPSSGVSTPVLQSRVATPVPQPTITPVLEVMREEPPQSSVRTSTTAAAAEEEEEEPPQLPARAAAADASQQLAPAASSLSSADAAAEEAAESDTDTSEGEAAEGGAQLVNGKNDGSGSDDEESVVEGAMEEDEIASEKSESAPLTDAEARGGERESSSVAIPAAAETTADDDSGAALGDDAAAAAAAAAGSAKPRYEFSDDSDDEKEEEEGVGAGELSSATAAAADTGSLAVDVVDAVAGEAFPSPLASPRFSGDDSDDEADAARLPKTADAMREDDDAVNREIGAEMRGFEDADGAQRDEAAPAPSVVEAGVAAAESSPEGITDLLVSSSPSAE